MNDEKLHYKRIGMFRISTQTRRSEIRIYQTTRDFKFNDTFYVLICFRISWLE